MSQGGLPPNVSVSSFEELELKEPTPSIAASLYESAQYSRKWRVGIALLVGGVLIALCLVGFHVNAESRRAEYSAAAAARDEAAAATGDEDKSDSDVSAVTPKAKKALEKPSATLRNEEELESSVRWRTAQNSCEYIDLECPAGYASPMVLLVGIDGVRKEMVTATAAPALHHLSRCGVTADHLTPVYPTDTFSNLYTIVTGLYPESHGIIGPVIHDAQRNKTFRVGKYESYKPYWWAGEPIWNTVQNEGLQSAMYYWPGSYVQVGGRYPTYWYKYRNDYPLETAVNKIQEWLLLEQEERPSFLGLYFDNPDKVAQEAGAYSKRANESLLEVDHQVDRLMTVLHDRNLSSCVDIIVVSDHGTAPSTCGNSLYLETFMPDIDQKARVVTGAVGRLQAIDGKGSNSEILNQLRCKNPKLRALSKDLLPNRYHYAHNPRIEEVILDTLPGNRIVTSDTNYCKKAEHGFNNIETSMQGVFLARGPSFKTNYKTAGFRNVEIYNLLNRLLGATPAPNNGTEGSLYHILRDPPPPPTIRINEWHENVLPFLHPRSRDPAFLEELRAPLTEPTAAPTTTSAAPTTPSTTAAPEGASTPASTAAPPAAAPPAVAGPETDPAGTALTTSTPATSPSTAPKDARSEGANTPNDTNSEGGNTPIDTNSEGGNTLNDTTSEGGNTPEGAISEEGKPLTFPQGEAVGESTESPAVATSMPAVPAESEVTSTPNVTEKTVPVAELNVTQTENPASAREAKTVGEINSTVGETPPMDNRTGIARVLSMPTVVLSSSENETLDFVTDQASDSDTNNSTDNPTISIERKKEEVTKIIADIVEIATSDPISLKDESVPAQVEANITSSTTATELGASSNTSTPAPLEQSVNSSTIVAILSTSQQPAAPEALNVSDAALASSTTAKEEVLNTSSSSSPPLPSSSSSPPPSSSSSSSPPSSPSPPATTPNLTPAPAPAAPPPPSSPPGDVLAPSAELPPAPLANSRKKRETCECSSSEILKEGGRGQPARSDHISHHCPFGVPLFEAREAPKGTHYILPFTNHVNGYIGELGTALWASFTLTNSSLSPPENASADPSEGLLSQPPCWLADPRLPRDPQQQCLEYLTDRYNTGAVTMRQLFPEEFESPEVLAREGFFLTNAVALRSGFVEGGRGGMTRLLRQWTALRSVVNVISGPVWDRNLNGRGDTIIHIRSRVDYLTPSHVFYIVSSCKTSSGLDMEDPDLSKCSADELDVLAFVFPNTDLDDDCLMSDRDYCRYHLTSVTDIERLTGLQVFGTFTGESALPALLAQQPLLLWED